MKKLINIQDKVNFLAECSEWGKSGRKKWNFKKNPRKARETGVNAKCNLI